jgi:RNA polymerase sigma-70 factor (ECF subfamily)
LVDKLTPVIEFRVARALRRYCGAHTTCAVEVSDIVQDVLTALFADAGRILRDWNPERGLSLHNWVGLISERHAFAFLRSQRRKSPHEDVSDPDTLRKIDHDKGVCFQDALESRDELAFLLEQMSSCLTPKSMDLFARLLLLQQDVNTVAQATGMSEAAVYAARTRLARRAREVLDAALRTHA